MDWHSQGVWLVSPFPHQCQEVISQLNDTHERIELDRSSPDIFHLLIPPTVVKRGTVKVLGISFTPLPINCLQLLSLSTNTSLQWLYLNNCSINDDGVSVLCKDLHHNTTLTRLDLSINHDITSSSALSELLRTNSTLTYLDLQHTLLSSDGVLLLLASLVTNNSLKTLSLDTEHKLTCTAHTHYKLIKHRLSF